MTRILSLLVWLTLIAGAYAQSGLTLMGVGTGASAGAAFGNTLAITTADGTKLASRTQGAGASRRKMTFSVWFRTTDTTAAIFYFNNNDGGDYIGFAQSVGADFFILLGSGVGGICQTTSPGTFANNTYYHVVFQIDTANATAGSRCKIIVNGTDITNITGAVTMNYDTSWGLNTSVETILSNISGTLVYIDELAKIDNAVQSAASFASVGHPIDLSALTFGTQGYWDRFETGVGATVGADSSGNGRTFTNTNFVNGDFSATVP